MAYVAVKGGEQAIENAEQLVAALRRGDPAIAELTLDQIEQQLSLAVDRVMAEGSLYDPSLAALAIKQAWGDLIEAIFLLRAYRSTLPRLYTSEPLNTSQMRIQRRVSGIFKDIPGGQYLGPTFDYIHRVLDFKLAAEGSIPPSPTQEQDLPVMPGVLDALGSEGLIHSEQEGNESVYDLTQQPLRFPASRDARLQNLARADEGFLLSLAYATQRGYGDSHPFAGEIRMGWVDVVICPDELGFEIVIGEIKVTEVQMVNQFTRSLEDPIEDPNEDPSVSDSLALAEDLDAEQELESSGGFPQFTRGYGLTFGHNERKAMSMALVDRALRAQEFGEPIESPAHDEEFVMYHSDNVQAQGFVQHLKLPHYIDFQAELNLIRQLRQDLSHSRGPYHSGDIAHSGDSSQSGDLYQAGDLV